MLWKVGHPPREGVSEGYIGEVVEGRGLFRGPVALPGSGNNGSSMKSLADDLLALLH
jgi:hypothetical protein